MLEGNILKMKSKLLDTVEYSLPLSGKEIGMNQFLGKHIKLEFTGIINDIHDGKEIKKSFGQGFSYPNFMKLACNDACILSPEKCHFHLGTCREPEWGKENCFIDHYVYLSLTSGMKVGITRHSQVPTRWIDQGAVAALPLVKVKDRLTSGLIEKELKTIMSDKTSWQRMLKNEVQEVDLEDERERLYDEFADLFDDMDAEDIEDGVTKINYPVLEYPKKVKSMNFDKQDIVEGTLLGIKGQYLMLDTGVINMRRHQGYYVKLSSNEI